MVGYLWDQSPKFPRDLSLVSPFDKHRMSSVFFAVRTFDQEGRPAA